MKARQNPLSKLEAFMQRLVEGPFARIFPSRLEPVEIARKLERALEDNTLLQGEGRRLAPNVYDVYLSIKDHQQMSQSQAMLIRDWQNHLVEFARQRHFTLRTMPLIRLHSEPALRTSMVRIVTEIADRQGGPDGAMATQAFNAEQMARLRANAAQPAPGVPATPGMPVSSPSHSNPDLNPANTMPPPSAPDLPPAWLVIRVPSGQQNYRIEKSVVNIGRQLSNDIIVEDKRVSRYHAKIKFEPDGQFAIYDLGSTNGITINNIPNQRQHVLHTGDRFTIGSYDFYFERR